MAQGKAGEHIELCGRPKHDGTGTCTQPAGWDTTHPGVGPCSRHGGAFPQAERKYQAELIRREAELPDAVPVDPTESILWAVAQAHRDAQYWTEYVEQLPEEQRIRPSVTTRPRKLRGAEDSPTERVEEHGPLEPHPALLLKDKAVERSMDASRKAISAGVEMRQQLLREREAHLIVDAIKGIAEELGIAKDPRLPGAVRKHLSRIAQSTVQIPQVTAETHRTHTDAR